MNESLEQVRAALRESSEALARRDSPRRTPKQRDDDLEEAWRAHRHAASILDTLQSEARSDHALVEAIAPLQYDVTDLGILLSEIRFNEPSERLPRLWQAEG